MHARTNHKDKSDQRELSVNGQQQMEYDGLHSGELAWILGRRFKSEKNLTPMSTSFQQALSGLGNGVDRMQRLASTPWIEALFEQRMGDKIKIDLHDLRLDAEHLKAMEPYVASFAPAVGPNDTVLESPDIPFNEKKAKEEITQMVQGLNVVDTSPFLRGQTIDTSRVQITMKGKEMEVPRNLGDMLSIAVLECELRRKNLMDWTPDGIVMSKLESPTDEPMTSSYIDARQAQLFNVGIQGPTITKTWTGKDHRFLVQPMDKVFVVLKARLSYTTVPNQKPKYDELKNKIASEQGDELQRAQEALKQLMKPPNDADINKMRTLAAAIRSGEKKVSKACLSEFRIMRTTSSHMTNYSYYKLNSARGGTEGDVRLGLELGVEKNEQGRVVGGVRDVVLGGWCVGTVIDSAASRSTIGFQTVKTHPTKMAINVNVNVQWWSGDKLYKHYHDSDGMVTYRGQKSARRNSDFVKEDVDVTYKRPRSEENADAAATADAGAADGAADAAGENNGP